MKRLLTLGLAALLNCSSPTAPAEIVESSESVKDYSFTFAIRVSFFQQIQGRVDRIVEARGEIFNEGDDLVIKPHLRLYATNFDKNTDNWFYEKYGDLGENLVTVQPENGISYLALLNKRDTLKTNERLYHFTLTDTVHQKGLIYWRFKFTEDGKKNPLEKIIEGELK